jgi:ornithine cyclodeaminase/alanine dehydrogenase-like protein (mu-crystallin family)
LIYLNREEVEAICTEIDSVALMHDVFCLHASRQTILPEETYMEWSTERAERARSLNMPGYVGGKFRAVGTKIINANPANICRGVPRASGLTLLFDPDTARVQCIMEGAFLSALRTASVSVLCMRLLADGAKSLAIIGTGAVGKAHIELAARTFPSLTRAVLFDLNPETASIAAKKLQTRVRSRFSIDLAKNAEEAIRAVEVVILATTVTSGYIPYEWLKPGALVVNVSLDDLLPEVFLNSQLLLVDDWRLVQADSRRVLGRMNRQGSIVGPKEQARSAEVKKVDGEIGDLLLGYHPGRNGANEVVVVNPFGLAIEDVALASRIFEIAESRNIGTELVR